MTLSWAIDRALADNPEVAAAEARWRAMRERPPQAAALPDPSLTVRYHNEGWEPTLGESEFSFLEVGVEQELPFIGKRTFRRRIAEREVERELAMRDMTALTILARVGVRFAELVALERTNDALVESAATLDDLIAQAAARYTAGTAEQQDVLRLGLEREAIRERVINVTTSIVRARADLAALIGLEPSDDLPPTFDSGALPELRTIEDLRARSKDQSPALRAAREEVLRAEQSVHLAKREYFPDVALMAAYTDKDRLLSEWEVGLRVTLPLYFASKQRRAVSEAVFSERAAERGERLAELELEAQITALQAASESASRLLALYRRSLIPSAVLTFESARASYATGRVDLLTTLTAFVAVLEYRIREAEETANLMAAVAEVGPLVGETPLGTPLESLQ
jgi:outer membrane protein TolC